METRSERLEKKRIEKRTKEVELYSQCMNKFDSLISPILLYKSNVLYPVIKDSQVFVPLHNSEKHLEFYFEFFNNVVKKFNINLDEDVCSLIFEEGK